MRFSFRRSRFCDRIRIVALCCVLPAALFTVGCSIPNLEKPECAEARDAAKRFYSFHFGGEMTPSSDRLKERERFLTPKFYASLNAANESEIDPFTMSKDNPKTFKVGVCTLNSEASADMQIQLYWRDDRSTIQKEVVAKIRKDNGNWLLDAVGPAK